MVSAVVCVPVSVPDVPCVPVLLPLVDCVPVSDPDVDCVPVLLPLVDCVPVFVPAWPTVPVLSLVYTLVSTPSTFQIGLYSVVMTSYICLYLSIFELNTRLILRLISCST